MIRLIRRFLLWTIVCTISAAPSYVVASDEFDRAAMGVGVALFILIYTSLSMTPWFEWFHNRPHVRATLYIGYGLRMAMSVAFPIGMFADMYPGVISIRIVESLGLTAEMFWGTLATTIVQGTILNICVFIFMLLVYGYLWVFGIATRSKPAEPRGFDVLPPAPER